VNCLGNEGRTLIKVLGEMSDVVYLESNVAFLKTAVTTDVSGAGLPERDRCVGRSSDLPQVSDRASSAGAVGSAPYCRTRWGRVGTCRYRVVLLE
jgi:hypothetical protein